WVGWYGFNAGSALGSNGIAANAFTTTTLATAVASFTWAMLEYVLRGKASVLGFCSGAVGGLVVITPACGYVDPTGAIIIGVVAGIVPFFACTKLKSWFHYDDALVKLFIGLRIAPEVERQGLDINEHGEEGYIVGG